ncbi:MAG: glycosyltransferase [Oscillospiraceae bacterium]|nr:glycosyltransferase [Oscillospiraceae bacterium]
MTEPKLRIAMFTDNYYPFIGGVPISIDRLTQGLRKLGHHVTIFAPRYPGATPDDDPDIIRCKLIRYHKTKMFDFAVSNIFAKEIEDELLRRRCNVVHVHHPFWMGVKGLNLGKKHGLPVLYTHHTMYSQYSQNVPLFKSFFKSYISHSIIKRFSQKCDVVFSTARTSKNYLDELGVKTPKIILPTGVQIIPDGAGDAVRSQYVSGSEVLLCSVLRLSPEKNIPFMLKGLKQVKERSSTPFKCIIVGGGPEMDNLQRMIRDLGLAGTVILVGSVLPSEVGSYVQASDIFIFASTSETQGVALFEAMAGHCPVVAVNCSGADEVIVEDYNGFLVEEDLDAWVSRVTLLLDNPDERRRLADNAYHHAELYSTEAVAQKATNAYIKAIKAKREKSKA